MIQKRNRFSTNSQKSKKIALDFQPLANPKIENMKRRLTKTSTHSLPPHIGFWLISGKKKQVIYAFQSSPRTMKKPKTSLWQDA